MSSPQLCTGWENYCGGGLRTAKPLPLAILLPTQKANTVAHPVRTDALAGDLPNLFGEAKPLRAADMPAADIGTKFGLLPRQRIRAMANRRMISAASGFEESQFQPASLDLRLGSKGYRIRASFLPGRSRTVEETLAELSQDEINLGDEKGAVLDKGCVYLIELQEVLNLQDSISAVANPKSSTGRLDIFTRLIADRTPAFDTVPGGYTGKLYAEVSPRSFDIRVHRGSRLLQLRFRRRNSQQSETGEDFRLNDRKLRQRHLSSPLADGELELRNGLVVSVNLKGDNADTIVGYRARSDADIIDVERVRQYDVIDFWEPIVARRARPLILAPHHFYILASKQRLHIPADLAAEMVPIDPMMGEFRVHYAGFFDPGFGMTTSRGSPGSRAVLEVRSHEVPFVLEDDQAIGRLAYETLSEAPDEVYGASGLSNYQGQGLKLSKHFL